MSARRLSRLDFDDPAFVADPYPSFHAERARGPVSWHEPSETWLVVDHAACSQALRDRRLGRIWHDRQPAAVFEPFNLLHRNQMMENEPPNHSRLRRKVSAAFARGHVERMRPRVIDLGATLLDDVAAADGSEFDALADFAEPLPVLVIAELLGAPRSDIDRLRAWSQAIVRMYEPSITPEVQDAALAASQEFADYMRELIGLRRGDLGDDLLSDLLRAQEGDDGLTDDEVLASAILLLNAGHEASVNVFGNGLVALLEHPDQWQRLVDGAVDAGARRRGDAAVRLGAPALRAHGHRRRRGRRMSSCPRERRSRCCSAPPTATRPCSTRQMRSTSVAIPNPHLAFGVGVHFCLGAPLARVELAESLRLLVTAYPALQLSGRPTTPSDVCAARIRVRPRGHTQLTTVQGLPAWVNRSPPST